MTDHTAALRDGIRILAYRLQSAAYNNGNIDAGEWSDKKYSDAAYKSDAARDALMAAVDAALAHPQQPAGWRPIDTVSEGNLVVVFWEDKSDPANPERYDFDYLEDGTWMNHHDRYEHMLIAGAHGLKEKAPYTHWMALGTPSAHPSQQEEDVQRTEEIFDWLETELSAIDCRYHGDPSYDHDAYWMRERVQKLIAEARTVFSPAAAQGDAVQGGGKNG